MLYLSGEDDLLKRVEFLVKVRLAVLALGINLYLMKAQGQSRRVSQPLSHVKVFLFRLT